MIPPPWTRAYLRSSPATVSRVSVCAIGPEGVCFARGYGFRDAAHAIAPDVDTVFGVASMSKSITALALAILETEGKVSYDDPVYRYFPDFNVPAPPATR